MQVNSTHPDNDATLPAPTPAHVAPAGEAALPQSTFGSTLNSQPSTTPDWPARAKQSREQQWALAQEFLKNVMNDKDPQVIERFIELRAQGWSFARIAAELDVSKPTLIHWSRQHQHRIRNLRALEMEAATEQCQLSRRHCLESLADDERRLREELTRRDLKDISTARLLLLVAALRKEANALNGPLRLSEPIPTDVPLADQVPEVAISWEG